MRAWLANDQDVAHLQAKTLPKNLIWDESAQWLLSSGVRKIPGDLIMPMSMPIWANDQDVAHLQTKTVPMILIWSELAQWLLSYGVRKVWAGRTDERTDGEHSIVPLFFPSERAGDKNWYGQCFRAIRQQAITWTSVDEDLSLSLSLSFRWYGITRWPQWVDKEKFIMFFGPSSIWWNASNCDPLYLAQYIPVKSTVIHVCTYVSRDSQANTSS